MRWISGRLHKRKTCAHIGAGRTFAHIIAGANGVVAPKTGNKLHSKGNKLPFLVVESDLSGVYISRLADALRAEVRRPGGSAKAIMRWTGASERAVKGWLGGHRGPSGEHLVALIANSDAVLEAVLELAQRNHQPRARLVEALRHLRNAVEALEEIDT